MNVHPSLMIIVSLDGAQYDTEIAADIKRSYVHLAPTTVRSHEAQAEPCNEIALKVNLAKKYWFKDDEGAEELWGTVRTWIANKRYFVGENIKSFNKTRLEKSQSTVDYRRLDLMTAQNVLHIAIEPGQELPALEEILEQVREFANSDANPSKETVEVWLPAEAVLAEQKAAFAAELAAAQAQAEQKAAEAEAQAETEEQPQTEGEPEAAEAAEATEPEAQTEEQPEVETPVFAIDYSVWGVKIGGGEEKLFDSQAGAWK